MTLAFDRRNYAIRTIVDMYIASEEDCLGQLVGNGSFAELHNLVETLRPLGRTHRWSAAITEWQNLIQYASKCFADNNGFSPLNVGGMKISDFTHNTGIDFARMLKWAVHEGALRCYNI